MGDWADEKAREWLAREDTEHAVMIYQDGDGCDLTGLSDSLAALLREVYGRARSETLVMCCVCDNAKAPRPDCECVICHRQRTLAEVRRVVKGVLREFERRERCANGCNCSGEVDAADEILSRLGKL